MQAKRPIAISRRFEPFDLSTRPPLFFGADDPTLCQNQGSRTHATQIITNVSSRKSERLCCARSSTPQWVYDAGAISHGVTASNLVLPRILTDTLISRSPYCVPGARYDGNVNLFHVVMTGFLANRGSRWCFPVQTLSAAVALRGATQTYLARAVRERARPPEYAAVHTGIEASRLSP